MPLNADYKVRRSWGEALRRRRHEMEMSQVALTIKANACRNMISQYERGGVVPSIIVGYRIVKALNWTVEEWAEAAAKIEADGSWYKERFDSKHDFK